MPAINRGIDGFFSDAMRDALQRRLREIGGLTLLALAGLLTLALATWSVQDPSLSHATNTPMRNALGMPGAVAADLLMQLFGLAAIALVLPVAIWGWRLISHRALSREGARAMFWIIGVIVAAACASALPRGAGWPLPVGLGGVIGDALTRLPAWLAGGGLTGWLRIAFVAATGTLTLACFAIGSGFALQRKPDERKRDEADADEDDEGRAWISLGFITHGVLSVKARLARLMSGRAAPVPAARRPAPAPVHARTEPRFEGTTLATLAPALDAELVDEEDEDDAPTLAPRKPKTAPAPRPRKSGGYVLPSLELLAMPKALGRAVLSPELLQTNATALVGVLGDFGVRGQIINARPGPVVTLYELEPAPGIKSSRVIGLADDIARSMSAISARVAVIPGKNAIGIELPNVHRETVFLRELLASTDFDGSKAKLALALGKTINGEPVIADLAKMPHLLVAGTTGSGKSVSINTMILSLLYRLKPEQCRLIMIDPKMLELSVYDGIPHLLAPVVTDPKKAIVALKWAV